MVDGTGSSRPSAMPRMVLRRILPERVFGSAETTSTSLKTGHRTDVFAHRLDQLVGEALGRRTGLEHDETARYLPP